MRIEFVLPYPPTVNTYWRRRGSTYFVSKGKALSPGCGAYCSPAAAEIKPVRNAGDKGDCRATG
ncbi:hypothetical protein ECO7815_06221 [Escherichia coli O55:H7 str. 3256-97]|nr:hypothetical protein ECO7815_06221 [Escherichia coli O55:H7 str. 3256-97]